MLHADHAGLLTAVCGEDSLGSDPPVSLGEVSRRGYPAQTCDGSSGLLTQEDSGVKDGIGQRSGVDRVK